MRRLNAEKDKICDKIKTGTIHSHWKTPTTLGNSSANSGNHYGISRRASMASNLKKEEATSEGSSSPGKASTS